MGARWLAEFLVGWSIFVKFKDRSELINKQIKTGL